MEIYVLWENLTIQTESWPNKAEFIQQQMDENYYLRTSANHTLLPYLQLLPPLHRIMR